MTIDLLSNRACCLFLRKTYKLKWSSSSYSINTCTLQMRYSYSVSP